VDSDATAGGLFAMFPFTELPLRFLLGAFPPFLGLGGTAGGLMAAFPVAEGVGSCFGVPGFPELFKSDPIAAGVVGFDIFLFLPDDCCCI
jgi:hypothetical protein